MYSGKLRLGIVVADVVGSMAAKLQTEEGKEIYSERKKIVEQFWDNLRSIRDLRDFHEGG
jgi:hypothetical protein